MKNYKTYYFIEYILRKMYQDQSSLKMIIKNGEYNSFSEKEDKKEALKIPNVFYESIFRFLYQSIAPENEVCLDMKKSQKGIFYFKVNEDGESVFNGNDYNYSPNEKIDFKNRPNCYEINTLANFKENSYIFEINKIEKDLNF